MNYYLRLQRNSEGYAGRVFEQLYAAPTERRAAARFLADAIRQAASVSPAWAITMDADSIRLNVGPARLMNFWDAHVWFTTTVPQLTRIPNRLQDLSQGHFVYKSIPVESRQYTVRSSQLVRLPKEIRASVFSYIHAAAAGRSRSSWYKFHSPGVVQFLESYLGTGLPNPEFIEGSASDPLDEPSGSLFVEGAVKRVSRNAYERSPAARAACLGHYGATCFACRVNLVERYGEVAREVIHVHHLIPLHTISSSYRVDPIRDLRPLCPNCHSVVHAQSPAISPEELGRILLEHA